MAGHAIPDEMFPQVNPTGATSANRMDIRATPAMFGGQLAQATEHLGQGVEKVGETGLDYLTAKVRLDNEVHSSELNTWLADAVTDRYQKFNTLEGRAASDALPQFKKDINDLYEQHMEKAGDNLALRAQLAKSGRYITDSYYKYGTTYADQQFKTYQDKTATNRAATYGAQAMVAYKNGDTNGMDVALNTSDDEVRKLYEQRGWDQDAIIQPVLKNRGHNLRNIIEAVSYDNPLAASALYRKYEHQMDEDNSRATLANIHARIEKAQGDQLGNDALRGTYQTVPPAATVQSVLDQAGARYGVSGTYLARTWQIESSSTFNPAPSSTGARGPFQFVPSTAKQYGLTNPDDFGQSAVAAARLAADNKAALTPALRREPTDAELYLAHQQGAGGAAKLLLNPTTRAGDLVGDQAIRVNGGNPDAPAAAFTNMVTAKFNGAGAAASLSRKAAAYQVIASDTTISEGVRDHAITRVNRDIAMQIQAEEQTMQQRRLRNEDASNEYVTKILAGQPVDMDAIANDPRLLADTKVHLTNLAESKGGGEDPRSYGPKYTETYGRIFADGNDPARITSADQILRMGAPGGGLNTKGVDRLMKIYQESRNQKLGEYDPNAIHSAKVGLLKGAQEQMARTQLIPGMGPVSMNLKGDLVYNQKFIPAFEAAFDAHMKKPNANPWDFLNKDNVDKLMNTVYPKAQRDKDSLEGAGEAQGSANEPLPPPPEKVNHKGWEAVVSAPPMLASGQPATKAQWGRALSVLADNPTEETKAAFDRWFGNAGFKADEVLSRLGRTSAAPAPALPQEAISPAAGQVTEVPREGAAAAPASGGAYFGGARMKAPTREELAQAETERAAAAARERTLAAKSDEYFAAHPTFEAMPSLDLREIEQFRRRDQLAHLDREETFYRQRLESLDRQEKTGLRVATRRRESEKELERIARERKALQ